MAMPAPDDAARRVRPLLTVLFWVGVGLAPLAAALLLLGQSNGPMRIAAVLAVFSVVLIGLSIAMRGNPQTIRDGLAEVLFSEIDGLHRALRADIETAARATHLAFGQRCQTLQEQVDALRGQLDGVRAEPRPGGPTGVAVSGPPGRARTGPQTDQPGDGGGGAYVRRTETVRVTTRHTIVDPSGDPPEGADGGYGGTVYGGHGVDRAGGRLSPYDRRGDESGHPDDGSGWTDLRAGDRWASVRADERGREFRTGERRAVMRADETGAELRIEGRWATVRQDEPPPSEVGSGREEGGWRADSWRMDGPGQGGHSDATPADAGGWRDAARGDAGGRYAGWADGDRGWPGARHDEESSSSWSRSSDSWSSPSGSWSKPSGSWGDESGSWNQKANSWGENSGSWSTDRSPDQRGLAGWGDARGDDWQSGRAPEASGAVRDRRPDFGGSGDRWR